MKLLQQPIGYCKHKNPIYKKKKVNKYTPEGRELIYKNISVSQTAIQYMLNNPIENRSIEYNDNRISLYVGQQGKCAVTGNVLDFYNMHCHHKIPRKMEERMSIITLLQLKERYIL